MDNLFSRFFAHYGLHLHTKRDFIKKRNGMRLFPGATVDDPAALKQTEPCGFEFEVVFCVCKMTYLFHTHILFHGRGDNREKNIMMLYLFHCLSFFFFLLRKFSYQVYSFNSSISPFIQISLYHQQYHGVLSLHHPAPGTSTGTCTPSPDAQAQAQAQAHTITQQQRF